MWRASNERRSEMRERFIGGTADSADAQVMAADRQGYDAVPRDGPAVFVADVKVFDESGDYVGRWIRLDRSSREVQEELRAMVSGQAERFAIIDQVDMGPVMVDEYASLPELLQLADEAGGDRV